MSRTIDTSLEYLLYALALGHTYNSPALLREVERFSGRMLAENAEACERAKALAVALADEQGVSRTHIRPTMLPHVLE